MKNVNIHKGKYGELAYTGIDNFAPSQKSKVTTFLKNFFISRIEYLRLVLGKRSYAGNLETLKKSAHF